MHVTYSSEVNNLSDFFVLGKWKVQVSSVGDNGQYWPLWSPCQGLTWGGLWGRAGNSGGRWPFLRSGEGRAMLTLNPARSADLTKADVVHFLWQRRLVTFNYPKQKYRKNLSTSNFSAYNRSKSWSACSCEEGGITHLLLLLDHDLINHLSYCPVIKSLWDADGGGLLDPCGILTKACHRLFIKIQGKCVNLSKI